MMRLITISHTTNTLLEELRIVPEWTPGSYSINSDGSWTFPIPPDVDNRLSQLRFPGESDNDLIFRILTTRKGFQ